MFSSKYGLLGIVDNLLRHGADPNVIPKDDSSATALIAAAVEGHQEVVKLLLRFGADATIKDSKGMTAQMWADKQHHTEIVDLLKQN